MVPRTPQRGCIAVVRVLAISLPLSLSLASHAQSTNANPPSLSACTKADLDIQFQFFSGPEGYFNFAVTGHNISGHACVFNGHLFDPQIAQVAADDAPKPLPHPTCKDCVYDQRDGKDFDSHPTVNPEEVVRKTYRWKTAPTQKTLKCVHPTALNAAYSASWLLVAPSLISQVCSDIEVVGIDVAPASAPTQTSLRPASLGHETAFQLTSPKSTYNEQEFFPLRLSRNPADATTSGSENCPALFIWHRSADGSTRMDEVEKPAFKGCSETSFGSAPGDWTSGFTVDSGAVSRWGGTGVHELQVFERVDPPGLTVQLASSNVLHVQISDPATLFRNWTRTKGVAANITLDKDTYRLGEDIPLHMAIANFDAENPLYSWDPVWDPCVAVSIEVQDAAGHDLSQAERFESFPGCSGHGFGPRPFDKGKIVPLEWHLRSSEWLPNHPGTYTVVLSWCTTTGTLKYGSAGWTAHLKPYATAQARATIHVVDADPSPSR